MENRVSGRGLGVAGPSRLRGAGASAVRSAVRSAVVGMLEQLETRRLMSGSVVEVNWMGHAVRAIEHSYVVQVKPGTDFSAVARRQGFTGVENLGPGGFYVFDSGKTPGQILKWGRNTRAVTSVQPNLYVQSQATTPNDPAYAAAAQWSLDNFGQPIATQFGNLTPPQYGTPDADIDAPEAWDITTGSKSVVVAILDTGMDIAHPDLVNNLWTNPNESGLLGSNGVDDDGNGYVDDIYGWNALDQTNILTDDVGHGSHVAGTIGAQGNNSLGVVGVNWNVSLLPVKVLGATGGSTASVIRGMQYITTLKQEWVASGGLRGADITVANLSLGADFLFPFDRAEARAFQLAGEAGILMTISAGNGGGDGIGDNIDQGFTFPGKNSLQVPNVISVAATDNRDNLALFSNFGSQSVQVAAPGVSILSTWSRTALTDIDGDGDGDAIGVEYMTESGTSMAAPHVAGVIALMKAANPAATPDQLRRALFSTVEVIPALSANLSGAPTVNTSGRVNAFKAILAIKSQFVTSDAVSRGNWQGVGSNRAYGREAAYVVGESTTFPAGITVLGGNTTIFADSTRDVTALQKISNPADRIAAAITSAGPITVDVDTTDIATGATPSKLVTLYVADYNNAGRGLGIELIDPTTGANLTGGYPQVVTNFAGGQYVTFQVTGHTQIRITPLNAAGAVLSGVFVDPVPAQPQLFAGVNATTRGDAQSTFGSQGAYIVGQATRYPDFVVVNTANAHVARARVGRRDQDSQLVTTAINGRTLRSSQALTSPSEMVLDFNFTDGKVHRTSFYAADFGNKGRAERFELIDAASGAVLARYDLTDFSGGKYVTFNMSGHQAVRITRLSGTDAVLSGVFFDAPAGQQVVGRGVDATTQGAWKSVYGSRMAYVLGESGFPTAVPTTVGLGTADVGTVAIASVGGTPQVLSGASNHPAALQRIGVSSAFGGDRVLARLASRSGIITDLYFSDEKTRQVAVYMVDSDTKNKRVQRVTLSDPTTGEVLAQQDVSNFSGGKYVVFDAKGPVRITIGRLAGPNAVVNGFFVD